MILKIATGWQFGVGLARLKGWRVFMKKKKKTKNISFKQFMSWSVTFSQLVFKLITEIWVLGMVYASALILIAIFKVEQFSYIDTLITELCDVFKVSVCGILIKSTIENVFRYNNIFGDRVEYNPTNTDSEDE